MDNQQSKTANDEWRRKKIRDAAFGFFLWSLPEHTPSLHLVQLADRLTQCALDILDEYRKENQ